MSNTSPKPFRLRSFVRRGRRTSAQQQAFAELWPAFGLSIENGYLDDQSVFLKAAPVFLEIGFGSGQSLLEIAKREPDKNFIGVETHQPGIGALFLGIKHDELKNIRVYENDVIDVLEKCIRDSSLDGVQIFFPDPWQKRRHRERRLIQPDFVRLVLSKLKPGGSLHLATDWEDYAAHMLAVVSAEMGLVNLAGEKQFATDRSPYRPILTKFEQRALREGRKVWELILRKR